MDDLNDNTPPESEKEPAKPTHIVERPHKYENVAQVFIRGAVHPVGYTIDIEEHPITKKQRLRMQWEILTWNRRYRRAHPLTQEERVHLWETVKKAHLQFAELSVTEANSESPLIQTKILNTYSLERWKQIFDSLDMVEKAN